MDRLLLDAGVLFSRAMRSESRLRWLWNRCEAKLLCSRLDLEEARRNLAAPQQRRLDCAVESLEVLPACCDRTMHDLLGNTGLPRRQCAVLADALRARATHLLTGDVARFEPCMGKAVRGVWIRTPAEYLAETLVPVHGNP